MHHTGRRVGTERGWGRERVVLALALTAALGACSRRGPPPDYAPDPALVARIEEIRMHVWPPQVCPGETVQAEYTAIMDDGSAIPFVTWYDRDDPPPLHVLFLRRTSLEAVSRGDGGWHTDADPLKSAVDGFRLRAEMRHRPDLVAEAVVAPEYSCTPYAFGFEGPQGGRGRPGGPGPNVTVRLDEFTSPFVDRLLVVGVEVGNAPPFFLLQDLERVPPADWLLIESMGGRGGRGIPGEAGAEGARGPVGCPGGQGGTGGAGGRGGPGGGGGPGGPITVVVSSDNPYLAGLVDGRSIGGPGGPGGPGGEGGPGGPGGPGRTSPTVQCEAGEQGEQGPDGRPGPEGPPGGPGARPQVVTASPDEVFGHLVPPELRALQEYARGRR